MQANNVGNLFLWPFWFAVAWNSTPQHYTTIFSVSACPSLVMGGVVTCKKYLKLGLLWLTCWAFLLSVVALRRFSAPSLIFSSFLISLRIRSRCSSRSCWTLESEKSEFWSRPSCSRTDSPSGSLYKWKGRTQSGKKQMPKDDTHTQLVIINVSKQSRNDKAIDSSWGGVKRTADTGGRDGN